MLSGMLVVLIVFSLVSFCDYVLYCCVYCVSVCSGIIISLIWSWLLLSMLSLCMLKVIWFVLNGVCWLILKCIMLCSCLVVVVGSCSGCCSIVEVGSS